MTDTTATTTPTRPVTAGTAAAPGAAALPAGLPAWFFCFEGVLAASFDLCKAYPPAIGLLGALVVVNIAVSLTVLRSRIRLARALWGGKGTRKVALGLVALRVGLHLALNAVGLQVVSVSGHLLLAALMGGVTVWLLWFSQRTALRALAARAG